MEDSKRRISNVAMEQIIGNVTSSIHNNNNNVPERQYSQLNYNLPPNPSEQQNWNITNAVPKSPYLQQYDVVSMQDSDPRTIYSLNQQLPSYNPQSLPFNYVQPSNIYPSNWYGNQTSSNYVDSIQPNPGYKFYANNFVCSDNNMVVTNPSRSQSNPAQLIENVVGNWVPNTNGTYSPFGNFNVNNKQASTKIFEGQLDTSDPIISDQQNIKLQEVETSNDELLNFHFNRDTRKPRIVAEVKPMRPTYSDVLTKSAPPLITKMSKSTVKDVKLKKESKKSAIKAEKLQKTVTPPRQKVEKNVLNMKTNERIIKDEKTYRLEQKWSSLENLSATENDSFEEDNKKNKKDFCSSKVYPKVVQQKVGKKGNDFKEVEISKVDVSIGKSCSSRKSTKTNSKQKNDGEKANKRNVRSRKQENKIIFGFIGSQIKEYVPRWWKFVVNFLLWLFHLIMDICNLSIHLSTDLVYNCYKWSANRWLLLMGSTFDVFGYFKFVPWVWDKIRRKKTMEEVDRRHAGLTHNITMPTTGDEAMKRLLACKGKDPYSILGVTHTCCNEDIKRYYKRQAFLVHPDKNHQPGAEEAFKILVHAFDMIGKPERRASYDRGVAESVQVEQAWTEFTELLAQLQKKVEVAANTIRCSACGLRHKRIKIDKPNYAARNCATCKIHHAAKEGDIWAETQMFGFLWHYFACMEGGIYDITEWAGCQKESLKHIRPNSHQVQYRIALGKQNGQTRRRAPSPRSEKAPDLENLLNSLYGERGDNQNVKRKSKKAK